MLTKRSEKLKDLIPFELTRTTSLLSVILALVISGFLSKVGEYVLDLLLHIVSLAFPFLKDFIARLLSLSIEVNAFGLILFALILFPIYRYVDKKLLNKKKKELVFEDDFEAGNKGWRLNYWGSNNPNKTNRIENYQMIFEAKEDELTNSKKEFGAYFDLKNGIYEGLSYNVSCIVRASPGTTMRFQLWLHDTKGDGEVKFPSTLETLQTKKMNLKTSFQATSTNALRIHLHNKAGNGRIMVDRVRVEKVGE